MTSRVRFALVIVLALGVVGAAALQGPLTLGAPRIDLLIPHRDKPLPAPSEAGEGDLPLQQRELPDDIPGTDLTPLMIALVLIATAAAIALVALIIRTIRRRRRNAVGQASVSLGTASATDEGETDEPDVVPALTRGIAHALQVLEAEAEPTNAIIAAWLGLQQSAEDTGIRRAPSETPSEFTIRLLARHSDAATDVRTLLRLYLDVRFGGHRASSADVAQARESLRAVQEVWS